MSRYAVALADPAAAHLAPAGFLSSRPGFDRGSARAFLLSNPGFVGRALPLDSARALAAGAEAAGFRCVLADEADLPSLPLPLTVQKAELQPGGFRAVSAAAAQFVPFDSVSVFYAAAWDAPAPPASLEALRPGLLARLSALAGVPAPPPPEPAPKKETFFRADILTSGGLRLQLRPECLDFSPLGPARAHSSLQNFRALLDLLSAPAFNALKPAFLHAFLASSPLPDLKCPSEEAADAGLVRLLLVRG